MSDSKRRASAGFTLIEVLVVCAIIAILLSVSIPGIARYIRTFRLRAAVQQVSGQLQMARNRAVMKNVNIGVMWNAPDNRRSVVVVEDDLRPREGVDWFRVADWAVISADTVQSNGARPLPIGITFVTPANCGAGGAGNTWGIRFNRLGAACGVPNVAACGTTPTNPPAGFSAVFQDAGGILHLCLHSDSGLEQRIRLTPGGRVLPEEGFR